MTKPGTTIKSTRCVIPGHITAGKEDTNTPIKNTTLLKSRSRFFIDLTNENMPKKEIGIKKFNNEPKLFIYSMILDLYTYTV